MTGCENFSVTGIRSVILSDSEESLYYAPWKILRDMRVLIHHAPPRTISK